MWGDEKDFSEFPRACFCLPLMHEKTDRVPSHTGNMSTTKKIHFGFQLRARMMIVAGTPITGKWLEEEVATNALNSFSAL